jgi:hypothetical protein
MLAVNLHGCASSHVGNVCEICMEPSEALLEFNRRLACASCFSAEIQSVAGENESLVGRVEL